MYNKPTEKHRTPLNRIFFNLTPVSVKPRDESVCVCVCVAGVGRVYVSPNAEWRNKLLVRNNGTRSQGGCERGKNRLGSQMWNVVRMCAPRKEEVKYRDDEITPIRIFLYIVNNLFAVH
jgi:hypothetical protein